MPGVWPIRAGGKMGLAQLRPLPRDPTMDIQTLQAAVRDFAAVRHWPRFHTPKNLAMALMVEAAELLEIFQWLTPDESSAAASDPAKKQHIGEEIADVQIYLLQMAEHTRVDLAAAVLDKLQRNARKYPAPDGSVDVTLPALPVADQALTHVLVDYENVQPTDEQVRALVPDAARLWVFHGPHQRDLGARFASFGQGLTVVPISQSGKNALDFHLSFYMGYIAARNPHARFVVLANDKGYGPMLEHVRQLHFDVQAIGLPRGRRVAAPTPARKGVTRPAAKKARPVQPPVVTAVRPTDASGATKAVARKAPAKKTPAKPVAASRAPARKTAKVKPLADVAPSVKAPVRAPARKTAAKPAPAPSSLKKVEQDLLKLGPKRPTRLARLRGVLKSLLGPDAAADAIDAALSSLQAAGIVVVDRGGQVSYPPLE
jgi:NTP pyrophosphatase (non-canonical NTP hydrolase)